MSDSVDRVFSHALNTVNKIRTGSQKPPSATRLQLYGLYKQAMEGDVDGIMERPEGSSEPDVRAREKWDAWKQQNRLSRTEAKRRYISTLIDTMHTYASPSPDSRELVAELEFVWDQVKSNVPSSSSSSPSAQQTLEQVGMHLSGRDRYSRRRGHERGGNAHDGDGDDDDDDQDEDDEDDDQGPLQIRSPMSQSEEHLEDDEAQIDRDNDEFVDAPDSQYNPATGDDDDGEKANTANTPGYPRNPQEKPKAKPQTQLTPAQRIRSIFPEPIPLPSFTNPTNPSITTADAKWRTRIESALIKQTAEIAALREQLEARRLFTHTPTYRLARAAGRFVWAAVRHVAVDVLLLGVVLLWVRWRRGDRRFEGVVRVLLGDAVARVKRVGGGGGLAVLGRKRGGGG